MTHPVPAGEPLTAAMNEYLRSVTHVFHPIASGGFEAGWRAAQDAASSTRPPDPATFTADEVATLAGYLTEHTAKAMQRPVGDEPAAWASLSADGKPAGVTRYADEAARWIKAGGNVVPLYMERK